MFGVNSKSYFYSTLKKKIMKAMKFSFMRSIAVWWWMFYVPLLFVVFNIWFPTLFEFETVEHVVQLITWIITFLFFMFIVAVVMKDNIEINRNKEDSISLFDCFIAISCFFLFWFGFLYWVMLVDLWRFCLLLDKCLWVLVTMIKSLRIC